jgi:hypothetical protein
MPLLCTAITGWTQLYSPTGLRDLTNNGRGGVPAHHSIHVHYGAVAASDAAGSALLGEVETALSGSKVPGGYMLVRVQPVPASQTLPAPQ